MSWIGKLDKTYAALKSLDLPEDQCVMPISHTLQNAHINIIIDGDGKFIKAKIFKEDSVSKKVDRQIVLPATESSASRSSGEAPHPLADKIQYIAQDYAKFGGQKKAYFEGYKKQLASWCQSTHSHPKVLAVYQYISQGNVVADLVKAKVLFVDDDSHLLLTQWIKDDHVPEIFKILPKENGLLDQGSALVCWTVEIKDDPMQDTWKDPSIQSSWIDYDNQQGRETGLCFIRGCDFALSNNHPAKIRNSGDKAKLISSNDNVGFTYLGRFVDQEQAVGISFDASQKAHNALRFLISRQGIKNNDQVFLSWAVSGKPIPEPLSDTWTLFDLDKEIDLNISPSKNGNDIDHSRDVGKSYAEQLRKYMSGYAAKLENSEQIIILGIDSATPGRMSIIYYREFFAAEFLQNLETWHKQFAWPQQQKSQTESIWRIGAPAPKDIVSAAYGENVDENIKKKTIERLLPCIIDRVTIPQDLLRQCEQKVINRANYPSDKQLLWEKNLAITCALYRGFKNRDHNLQQRRDYAMSLERDYPARDYLYGRLLAVAERIEERALSIREEKRPTTAARLMQRFADHPFETWRNIELALQPYIQSLWINRTGFITNQLKEIDTIMGLFRDDDFNIKRKLTGEFLLGYHCQRQFLKNKSETNEKSTDKGDTE